MRPTRLNTITATAIEQAAAACPDPVEVFCERAEARAMLWAAGEYTLHEAVDVLQADAVRTGLVALIGQDAVQAIMAEAFDEPAEIESDLTIEETVARWECDFPARLAAQALNHPARRRDALSLTYDALLYELRTFGVVQFANPNCQRRLADLSIKQVRELIAALMRLKPEYPAITDELLLKLGEQL